MAGTTTLQAMRFEVGADISPLKAALAEASQKWKELADAIKEQFKEATVTISDAVAKGIAETGGIQGAVEGAFAGASNAVSGFVKTALALIPGLWGKLAAGVYSAFEAPVNSAIDNVTTKIAEQSAVVAEKIEEALGRGSQAATKFADTLGTERLQAWIDAIKTTAENRVRGSAFDIARGDIEKRLQDEQREVELLGKTAEEVFNLRTQWAMLKALGIDTLDKMNEVQRAAYDELVKTNAALAVSNDETKKAYYDEKERARTITAITTNLQRQTEMELANADALNKTAGARARERAEAQARGYGRKGTGQNVVEDPTVQAAIDAASAGAGMAASIRFNTELAQQIKLQTENYDVQTRSLGATAGETARLKFVQSELVSAQRLGVVVTDELRESIDSAGQAVGAAAQRAAEAQQAFQNFMAVGRSVAGSLESAFDKWISGTRVSFKSLINDMARDLAKLAFKQSLIPLFGGGTGGSLLGSLGNALFGLPKFADGGSISGPAIVGEKGPELFVPRSAGTIVPNAAAGRGQTNITMRIDLAGANGDETIARISAQAARFAAMAAVEQSNQNFSARSRELRMLGT